MVMIVAMVLGNCRYSEGGMTRYAILAVLFVVAWVPTVRADFEGAKRLCVSNDTSPDASISACTRLIQSGRLSSHNLAITHYNRGGSYRQIDAYNEAVQDYDEAIRRRPDYAHAFGNRGLAHEMLGRRDAAIQDFKRQYDLGSRPKWLLRKLKNYGAIAATAPAKPAKPRGSGRRDKLRGFKIWVSTKSKPLGRKYCKLLTEAGLIVECDPGRGAWSSNTIYLKCGRLPADAGVIVQEILGISGWRVADWRSHKNYGVSYCDEIDAIDFKTIQ